MDRELLLEIGVEELPASWLPGLVKQLEDKLKAELVRIGLTLKNGAEAHATPRRLTVCVPELVDPNGNITSGHAIAWRGAPVREQFRRLGPAVVESDVRAHALAEARYGAGRSFRLFAFVTVGTGISC